MKYETCVISSFSPTPTFVLVRANLMIEKRTFVVFMTVEKIIFSFVRFYLNKICMMGELHKNI